MPQPDPMWQLEQQQHRHGCSRIAGVDEAGRGAWAGPVVVAAVILPLDWQSRPYRDSKTLGAKTREKLAARIKLEARAWAAEFAHADEIDACGVLVATKRASVRALLRLQPQPDALITDYLKLETAWPCLHPAKADSLSYSVAAASIIAKTVRDAWMRDLHLAHPGYGFDAHKGYGAIRHRAALEHFGLVDAHRRSFKPMALLDGLFGELPPR